MEKNIATKCNSIHEANFSKVLQILGIWKFNSTNSNLGGHAKVRNHLQHDSDATYTQKNKLVNITGTPL